ncbi:hypothetical protein AALP_AA2G109100 [Arabis alpina]|uniref:Uncharacterized protein n=1 Tax=Arabis alpina TaxID=50452 RepID=A0A087HGM4_ARAAL|nr:hypothetical protein AALP_AA2G109100 [Arabis alpina]
MKIVDIKDHKELGKAIDYALGACVLTIFVVCEDDSFISRRIGCELGFLCDDDFDGDDDKYDDGNGGSSGSESDGSENDNDDFNACVVICNGENDSSSGTKSEANLVDEMKYRSFMLGQEYRTIKPLKVLLTGNRLILARDHQKEPNCNNERCVAIC